MSDSCLCTSGSKWFLLNSSMQILRNACGYDNTEVAQNLLRQDYEAVGNCIPLAQRTYAIRLTYNTPRKCGNNGTHPYFWGRSRDASECVNGKPLSLPFNFEENSCHLAVITPGSFNNIFNANWIRCNATKPYICQLQTNNSHINRCKQVTTTSSNIASSSVYVTSSNNAINNVTATSSAYITAISVGTSLGVVGLFLFLLLCYFLYKRKNTHSNSSDKSNQEVHFK